MIQDRQGFLWIGTSSEVARYDGEEFRIYDSSVGLRKGSARSIHETADGTLWVRSDSGLAYREGHRFRAVQDWIGRGVDADEAIVSRNDILYVASRNGLLRSTSRPGGKFVLIPTPREVGPSRARSLFMDRDGTLWVTLGTTLCRLESDGLEVVGRPLGLPDSDWRAVKRDVEGTLRVRDSAQIYFQRWQEEPLASDRGRWKRRAGSPAAWRTTSTTC